MDIDNGDLESHCEPFKDIGNLGNIKIVLIFISVFIFPFAILRL